MKDGVHIVIPVSAKKFYINILKKSLRIYLEEKLKAKTNFRYRKLMEFPLKKVDP